MPDILPNNPKYCGIVSLVKSKIFSPLPSETANEIALKSPYTNCR